MQHIGGNFAREVQRAVCERETPDDERAVHVAAEAVEGLMQLGGYRDVGVDVETAGAAFLVEYDVALGEPHAIAGAARLVAGVRHPKGFEGACLDLVAHHVGGRLRFLAGIRAAGCRSAVYQIVEIGHDGAPFASLRWLEVGGRAVHHPPTSVLNYKEGEKAPLRNGNGI